jgi:hypothetical protein
VIELPKTYEELVDLAVECQREDVVLTFDGQPLAVLKPAGSSLALVRIRDPVTSLDARVDARSRSGPGTTVEVRLP